MRGLWTPLLGVGVPIHLLGVGFLPQNHSQLLSQGVLGCRMPGSPPAVMVRSLSWCSDVSPQWGRSLTLLPPPQP